MYTTSQFYIDNADFKRYVDKASISRKLSIDQVLQLKLSHEVMAYYLETTLYRNAKSNKTSEDGEHESNKSFK